MTGDVPTRIGKRIVPRLRVRVPAQLLAVTHIERAVLRDVSIVGAMLLTSTPVTRGEYLVLRWGEFETFGKISWISGNHSGMAFEEPIPQPWLLATRMTHDAMACTAQETQEWITDGSWVWDKAFQAR